MSKFNLEEMAQGNFDEVPEDTNLPAGKYLFEVVKARVDATKNDEPKLFLELTMRPVSIVDGDVEESILNNVYPVKDSLYLTPAAIKFTKRTLERAFGLDLKGRSYVDVAEALIGANVVGTTQIEEFVTRKGEPGQSVRVVRYESA